MSCHQYTSPGGCWPGLQPISNTYSVDSLILYAYPGFHYLRIGKVSEEFIQRLKSKQLTDVDQYRRMQDALLEIEKDDQESKGDKEDKEEWRRWQLAPVSAGSDSQDLDLVDPQSSGAQSLYQAIKVLDKK